MTSAVNLGNLISGTPAPASVTPVSAPAATSAAAPAKSEPQPSISPRLVIDPLAGLITQYLNGDGKVESQIPSTAAVAYIRAGLSDKGEANSGNDVKIT